ncbi:hypothetical protein Z947_1829 [Sulfitobacter geojensis]|nr:hypothetical protein Z947_1829 [Sulfitobacter geojensis]
MTRRPVAPAYGKPQAALQFKTNLLPCTPCGGAAKMLLLQKNIADRARVPSVQDAVINLGG